MDRRLVLLGFGVAGAITAATAAAGQHDGHQAGASAAPSAVQVTECRQAQPVITELLNASLKRLEDGRLTNSAAAMRDAADDVQTALVDMRTQLEPCGVMQAETGAPAGHAMPATPPPSAGGAGAMTAQPGSSVAAPSGGDAPAGHAMPATLSTPAGRAPAAADPHAGMVMPGATRPSAPAPAGTSGPATPPQSGATRAPGATAQPAAGAGHAAMAMSSGRTPVTALAELKCESRADPRTTPRMLYEGRMYYFCSVEERAEFAKSPEKYVNAPASEVAPTHGH